MEDTIGDEVGGEGDELEHVHDHDEDVEIILVHTVFPEHLLVDLGVGERLGDVTEDEDGGDGEQHDGETSLRLLTARRHPLRHDGDGADAPRLRPRRLDQNGVADGYYDDGDEFRQEHPYPRVHFVSNALSEV